MGRLLLRNAELLDPEAPRAVPRDLLLEDGRIEAQLPPGEGPEDAEVRDLAGCSVAPGFLDLHFHGSLIFTDDDFAASLARSGASLVRHGTTGFLATTVAWSAADLGKRVSRLASIVAEAPGDGAVPIGIHLEGPWLNPRAAGSQPMSCLRDYEPAEGEDVLARGEGLIRMVTLAPEIRGAAELQAALVRRGIVAALGHSRARGAEAERAVELGATHVTHLFNAMGGIHQREPGLAGTALVDERLSFDLICDGVHVDARMVRLAVRAKGAQLVLVTDRIELPESGDACFESGRVRDDGAVVRLLDGRLAGSRVTLERAVHNAQALAGMTRLEAIAACTLRPARVLGIEAERGTLRRGARADLVVLDGADRVRETWIGGRAVYEA